MSGLDLSRINVLVAEDSQFIRSLLINCLRLLGVGGIRSVKDGTEAIKFLQLVEENPMKAGMMSVDVIISDWEMSPIDGLMLLRWIRRHKDSPNRFIPFIMLTGYSEPKRIETARDMGVTEFMSKPFRINSIADKLDSIIQRPRQFVHNASYFGPDRRRQDLPFEVSNRRYLTAESPEVEIVNV